MSKTEIRVGGLGGQGVILSAQIIGKAASIYDDKEATLIQSFGPEARGSACSAQVTIDTETIGYPYVKNPDVLVVMSPDAYAQFIPTLKPGGWLLYEEDLITLDERVPQGVKAFGIPATRFAEELGRRLVLNIVMVGFFAGVTGLVSYEAITNAVKTSVPKGTEDLNLRALARGYEYGCELARNSSS
ncbi:MAG: 2-oxoacid:acceptor oxidoreductase family protein [Thermoanaerobaculaceae bacterium]|jgi:2-oxoglutarate ferredoxin oxidoreductase subunit gamma|nr:2-oxoacid:acceptor oxidoreductase family protein [Thermoanaerobaculaceae bacterium]